MRIQGNGNISVGAGAAAAKLDVKGNVKMGNAGNLLNNMIKFTQYFGSIPVGANNTGFVTVRLVNGAVKNSTVFVSTTAQLACLLKYWLCPSTDRWHG